MDHTLPSARPKATAIAWATKAEIFVEIPHRDGGPPYIARYRKTVEGLTAALNILIEYEESAPRIVGASHPKITKVPQGASSRASWATDDQRAKAREVLKRLKIT